MATVLLTALVAIMVPSMALMATLHQRLQNNKQRADLALRSASPGMMENSATGAAHGDTRATLAT